MANQLGLVVLEDPKFCDPQNVVHVAIYNMRWNPMGLVRMSAQDLCVYESALSAHQVYVQAQQNEWRAKFEFLGKERERVLREVRGQFRGDTEKAKEDAAIAQNAAVGKLHYEFVEAQAMATFLTDMGDRFSQLEDGLKRLISLRHDEERRTYIQGKFTT